MQISVETECLGDVYVGDFGKFCEEVVFGDCLDQHVLDMFWPQVQGGFLPHRSEAGLSDELMPAEPAAFNVPSRTEKDDHGCTGT